MPKFEYTGVTTGGKEVKGELQAASKAEVQSLLRKKKVRPVSIRVKASLPSFSFGTPVKLQDISRFTRQFAAMTSAGLPLVQCMEILSSQSENKAMADAVKQVSMDIQGGSSLAKAILS